MSPLRLGSFGELANSRRLGRVCLLLTPGKLVVAKSSAGLKLHVGEGREESPALLAAEQISALCDAFAGATGWRLSIHGESRLPERAEWSQPIAGGGKDCGRIALHAVPTPPPATRRPTKSKSATASSAEPSRPPASQPARGPALEDVRPLARAIAGLLTEMQQLRTALWQREAELAAGVPVAPRPDERAHLAERLEAVLQAGAEAVGCSAAGLYLLDEGTTSLKLRAKYGLPDSRLLEAPRPLRGAVADLEALVGHAVALEDTSLLPHWKCPEAFPAAACVPVSTSSAPLGTLWVFADENRDFSPEQTNLLEIIAGRLAADLEREMLLTASEASRKTDQQIAPATNWQRDRLPSIQPLIDNYEVAGWTEQAGPLGGDFHDWCVLNDGQLALSAGSASGGMLTAALGAAALHGALKAHAGRPHDPGQMLGQLNETLWTASPGDQTAALGYALLDPASGSARLALAGGVCALIVGPDRRRIVSAAGAPLGQALEWKPRVISVNLKPGESLVLLTEGVRAALDPAGLRIGEAAIANFLRSHYRAPAANLVQGLRELVQQGRGVTRDMTIAAVKHSGQGRRRPK